MSLKNSRLRIAFLALTVTMAGLAMAGPAAAATERTSTASSIAASTAPDAPTPALPTGFVDLPATPLSADSGKQEITVTYRNESSAEKTVAPQLLVESPDAGPFLSPSDIKVERRTAGGCWTAVPTGSQTGTLFTDLTAALRTLHGGETLTERYRVTAVSPDAKGTVHPRVALYG
ncbi:signal peptide protein [Streptomyces sp. NPDC003011]